LADGRGRLVGVSTAVAGVGLGLAVPIEMTVWRNGAPVDVFVVPRELAD
jgi:hypothetical protein